MPKANVFSMLAAVSMVIFCSYVQAQDAVVWLSFEGTGDIATDSSGNGNDGTPAQLRTWILNSANWLVTDGPGGLTLPPCGITPVELQNISIE